MTLTPPASGWSRLLRAATRRTTPESLAFRRELGLSETAPVILSGHQAEWWHAGILAKQAAMAALCRATDADGAWVVVDQDANNPFTLTYPAAAEGLPRRGDWTIAPESHANHARADVALHDLPPFTPAPPPVRGATPDITRGLRAIADCTARWSRAANAAEQIARANAELAASVLGASPTLIFATRILATAAGRSLLERMAGDPAACTGAYNRAVAASRLSTLAPLSAAPEKGRYELPLWRLSPAGRPTPRRRVFAATLGDAPLDALAPRALLMSALLRWLGCDLFIHGTGGGATGEEGGYDKVAEAWFREWLGVELAPSVVATATLLLPMGAAPTVDEADLRSAHRRVEQARHAPGTLGDDAAQRQKDDLVSRIAGSSDRRERRRLYRALQDHLESYRTRHSAQVEAASADVSRTAGELARQTILRDRTWPWPLLPRTMVLALQRRMDAEFALPTTSPHPPAPSSPPPS
ncbi:MAG TPA: hypothetical protein VEB22_04440 [Phycisphaerales bacterium]|nr:hypothetical protein [Phycisphaerales bacterium]